MLFAFRNRWFINKEFFLCPIRAKVFYFFKRRKRLCTRKYRQTWILPNVRKKSVNFGETNKFLKNLLKKEKAQSLMCSMMVRRLQTVNLILVTFWPVLLKIWFRDTALWKVIWYLEKQVGTLMVFLLSLKLKSF